MNTLIGLSPAALRRAADLKERIEKLQTELEELVGETVPAQAPGAKSSSVTKRGRSKGKPGRPSGAKAELKPGRRSSQGITTNAAILKALEGGKLNVPTIISRVTEMKGKASKAAIIQALAVLKKKGQITNPERGQYLLKK